jgi:peroxiredoxin
MLIRLSLLVVVFASCATARPAPAPLPQDPLPPIQLQTLDGQPAQLQQTLAGRVALVAVWATWCDGCAAEFEALSRLSDRAGAHGAVVVAVNMGESRDEVARFVAQRGLRYPQLIDQQYRLAHALGNDRVPTTLVIDRTGRVVYAGGALDENALAALRAALDGRVALR